MKSPLIIILVLVLAAFASGCLSEIQKGSSSEYEFPGLNNTTIYYLNGYSVQVVESVVNATTARFIIGEGGDMNFRNPVAVDLSGHNVSFNVSKEAVFGKSYVRFDFDSPFSGFVGFTQSDGQDFTRTPVENKSIRVVLPVNYTTGSRFLGIAQPGPDNVTTDASGREVLIWENPYQKHNPISVKYYHRTAPVMLAYLFIFLFIAAFLIMGYYYWSMRALKKKREMMEKGIER